MRKRSQRLWVISVAAVLAVGAVALAVGLFVFIGGPVWTCRASKPESARRGS